MPPSDDRLQDECRVFIEKLRGAKDTGWHDQFVVGWGRSGNVRGLRRLHEALRDVESETAFPPHALSSQSWSIEQSLAFIPDGHGVEALVELSSLPSPGLKEPADILRRWQQIAWVLANQQSLSTLLATLGHPPTPFGSIELLASWMHEWVARGHSLEEAEPARRLQELLVARNHPLAMLPLHHLGMEEQIRDYHRNNIIENRWRGTPLGRAGATTLPESVPREVHDAALVERLATVALDWAPSHRRLEARVFTLSPPISSQALSTNLLVTLGLACLGDMSEEVLEAISRVDATSAFRQLFAASAYGGPYAGGRFGAYGRLEAWRSLAALAGADERAPLTDIERLALACTWVDLRLASEWFYNTCWDWDVGVAALRPDGASLAVLAATGRDNEPEWVSPSPR